MSNNNADINNTGGRVRDHIIFDWNRKLTDDELLNPKKLTQIKNDSSKASETSLTDVANEMISEMRLGNI